ncbi:MAG: hypothetical protein E7774_02080 [Bradyrhizobium sp.]|nr:MAG: hypothetical protein E7774_02080 [Bradyrhizobium sp.]
MAVILMPGDGMIRKQPKPKSEQDRDLSRALEETFPASDPPAAIEPGGGITGPEAARSPDSSGKTASKRLSGRQKGTG